MNDFLNVGLVSFGYSSQTFHAPFIINNASLRLYAVLERHGCVSKTKYPWVKLYHNYEEFLSDISIDLVIITTPNNTHYQLTKAALDADKHVLVDKPFTVSFGEAHSLVKLAERKNKILTVYQNRRFDGDFAVVNKVLNDCTLGDVIEFNSHFDRFRPYVRDRWREQDLPGSGLFYDIGSHLIDQAVALFGLPDSVYAVLKNTMDGAVVDDYFDVKLEYQRLTVNLRSGNCYIKQRPRFAIFGKKASFIVDGLDPQEDNLKAGLLPCDSNWHNDAFNRYGTLVTYINDSPSENKICIKPGNYMNFYNNLYYAIIKKAKLEVESHQILSSMYILGKAFESSNNGKKVIIDKNFLLISGESNDFENRR